MVTKIKMSGRHEETKRERRIVAMATTFEASGKTQHYQI
jgi:hypothetical protein